MQNPLLTKQVIRCWSLAVWVIRCWSLADGVIRW